MAVANSFIFGNINTADYDVVIEGYGNYTAPKRAVEMVSVPGRNGAVVLDLGYYENGSASFVCVIQAFDQDEFAEKVARFRNAIVSQLGYQRLAEGYLPGEYRMAMYSDGLDDEPEFIGRAGKFEVNFNCKPQRWLTSGESAVTVSDGDSFYNPTPFDASPLLMVEGYGTIGFNGYEIEIENAVMGEVEVRSDLSWGTAEKIIQINTALFNPTDTVYINGGVVTWKLKAVPSVRSLRAVAIHDANSYSTSTYTDSRDIDVQTVLSTLSFNLNSDYSQHIETTLQATASENGTSHLVHVTAGLDVSYTASTGVLMFTFSPTVDAGAGYAGIRSPQVSVGSIAGESSLSILGHPTYIDCDLGDAYMIKDGSYISLNSYIDLGSDLPVLASGNNEMSVDSTITELKIVPRWWIL